MNSLKSETFGEKSVRRALTPEVRDSVESPIFELQRNEGTVTANANLQNDLYLVFEGLESDNAKEAFEHAVLYLAEKKLEFNLSDNQTLAALKSAITAFAEAFPEEGAIESIPQVVLDAFLPEKIASWQASAPTWTYLLTKSILESVESDYHGLLSREMIKSVFSSLQKFPSYPEIGFYAGYEPIEDFSSANDTMKFDNSLGRFMKFDPVKTNLLNSATLAISSTVFSDPNIDETKIESMADSISQSISESSFEFISELEGNHAIFAYEISKVASQAMVLGSVSAVNRNEELSSSEMPAYVSEKVSEKIAYHIINESLTLGLEDEWDLKRLAESSSFGASTGAQLAAVLDKSMEFTPNWESYERKLLARASASGSSFGAMSARASFRSEQYVAEDEQDLSERVEPLLQKTRDSLIEISKHASMGSLLGNVGLSINYPNPLDRLVLINFAAQGVTEGSIAAISDYDYLNRPDSTEAFDVEVARSSSNGAAFGATFQTTTLTDSNPRDFSADATVIKTVEAVTYGSTIGAITASNEQGSPVADALIFKQATKQGSIEGSLAGSSLGMGSSEEDFDDTKLRSRSSIIQASAKTNNLAAAEASSTMATKAIRTSTTDMLLLMKKFNINPRLTNPTKIFNRKSTNNEEAEFPFEEKLKVASPI